MALFGKRELIIGSRLIFDVVVIGHFSSKLTVIGQFEIN